MQPKATGRREDRDLAPALSTIPEEGQPQRAPLWHRATALVLKAVIAMAILAAGAWFARDILETAPGAGRTDRERLPRLVEVTPVESADQGPRIEAWGEVVARRKLKLRTEVGGRITQLNPSLTPGGLLKKDEVLFRLDDRTWTLDLARAEAAVEQVRSRILIEEGQQARAQKDLDRVPTTLNEAQRALVLRAPQMAELEAELAAAEAARDAAEVALSKTVVRAPFDAVVISEELAEGATVAANTEVAVLVAADAFRVELAVPVTALDWVDPEDGQTVRVTQPQSWPEGVWRDGRIERLAPDLTQTGRMAELMVSVPDPLAQEPEHAGKPPLLLGSFLQAQIEGREVADAVALPRQYVRDGSKVWVMNAEDRLEIRDVEIAWLGADRVLISGGLDAGERVVTTHLATVADGMRLRVGEADDSPVAGTDPEAVDG